ncbi:MAG: hypothetical protein ACLR8Y_14910 [Alistipes indistinctus]
MEVIQPNNEPTTSGNPTIIVNQPVPKSNGMGTAGFVLALLALFLGWVPVVGWIFVGIGPDFFLRRCVRTPKGLAIAGLIISLLGVILLLICVCRLVRRRCGIGNLIAFLYTVKLSP